MQMLDLRKEKLQKIAKKYELDIIILFGSYARGHANPESDVDIAIRTKLREHDWQWEFDLIRDLVFALDCGNLDIVFINSASPLLMFEIATDGIPLYEADDGAFQDFQLYAAKSHHDAKKIYRLQQLYLENRIEEAFVD